MKNLFKKVTTLVVALAMVFAMVVPAAETAMAEETSYTITLMPASSSSEDITSNTYALYKVATFKYSESELPV